MKTASKYLGLFLVLVLALTLVGFQASGVTAGDQKWTRGPNAQIGDQSRLTATANNLAFDVAADNNVIWLAGGNGRQAYKSSNAGATFGSPRTVVSAGASIVAVAISPDYATDTTIYVATATDLHRSTDDGNSWNPFSGANANISGLSAATHTITSMDVGKDSSGNTVIAIGTEAAAAAVGLQANVTTAFNGGLGAVVNTVTVTYTNQAGETGRTTSALNVADDAGTGVVGPFILQAGDTGVLDVTNITVVKGAGATSTGGVITVQTLFAGNAGMGTLTFAAAGASAFADGASTSTAGVVTVQTLLAGNASLGTVTFASVFTDSGTTTPTAGEVWVYKSDIGSWVDQNVARNTATAAAANSTEVIQVAFSPKFNSDGVLFAVVTSDNRLYAAASPARVVTKWSNFNNTSSALWAANWHDTDNFLSLTGATLTRASLAFPGDFDVINVGKNYYYLGLVSSTAAEGDVFRIAGRGAGSGFTTSGVTDLGLNLGVRSIAFTGNISGGTLLVGMNATSVVQRTTDVLSNTPVFTPATKSPVGGTGAVIIGAASSGGGVWASSTGPEGGFYRSTDGGVVFNGTALLQTTIVTISDYAVNPANTNEIIAVTQAAASSSVWRTTNNGDQWVRVWVDNTAVNTIDQIGLSPTYRTDKTFYLLDNGGTRIWRTADNGNTFFGVSAPLSAAGGGVTAWAIESGTNLVVGYGNGEVHRSTSNGLTWIKSVTGAGSAQILDILINPADAKEIFTTNTSGQAHRSRDSAATFRILESNVGAVTNATLALADGYHATSNPVVFLGTNTGIYRQRIGELRWIEVSADNATPATDNVNGLAIYATETLAATSPTAGVGIFRSTNAHRLTASTSWARARFNDAGIGGTITTKLLRSVSTSTATTLFMVETSTGFDTIYSYVDNLSKRIELQLPRSKSSLADPDRTTFTWTGIRLPDGGLYRLVIAYDSGFDQQLGANYDTEGTTYRLVNANFEPGKTYYWYVQGRYADASGDTITSPRGRHAATARGVTTYTTGEFYTGVARPTLVSPIGGPSTGGTDAALKPVLQWQQVEGANRYELQVDTSASFFAPFVNLTDTGRLDSTAYQIEKELEYSTTYYWRVRAATFTALGDWSTVGAFTTMGKATPAAPPIVIQQQPAPVINIPAATTPSWVWVVIVIGAILVIVMLVLIVRTRRV